MLEYDKGMEGSDCGAGAEFVVRAAIRFAAITQRLEETCSSAS